MCAKGVSDSESLREIDFEMTSHPPFFIVACGRSGTSLLRSMLNQHPRIAIPLESLFIVDYLRAKSNIPLGRLKKLMVREPEVGEWGLKVSPEDLESCDTIEACIIKLHELYMSGTGCDVWGQKTPRFIRYLDLLVERFPGSRVVHLVRDPRAVVSSLIRSDVHRSDAYHASLRWLNDVHQGLEFQERRPEITLRMRYEDLVTEPEQNLADVITFLGLSPGVVREAGREPASTEEYSEFYANIHANLNRRPTPDFIDKWRTSLTPEDVEVVEAICHSQMRELGYEPEMKSPQLRPGRVRALKVSRIYLTLLQFYRYLRYRRFHLVFLVWRKWRLGLLREFLWTVNY